MLQVQFVDYGNVEECQPHELREIETFGNIPIQTHKYCLANLTPIGNGKLWPRKTLDFLHAHVVGKICSVTKVNDVDNETENSALPCKLIADRIDVRELLIVNGMAEYTLAHKLEENVDILYDEFELNGCVPKMQPTPLLMVPNSGNQSNKPAKTNMDFVEYKKLFDAKVMTDLDGSSSDESENNLFNFQSMKNKNNDDCLNMSNMFEDFVYDVSDEDSIESDAVAAAAKNAGNISCSDDDESIHFQPNATSSKIEKKTQWSQVNSFHQFKILELNNDNVLILGRATFMVDAVNVWVCPQMDDFQQKLSIMSNEIQRFARNKCMLAAIKIGQICLAQFKDDNLFYRALVKHYDEGADEVTVIFVDYMNIEKVRAKDIRECPKSLLEIPLRNIQVRLHGVNPNPRLREFDVERQISSVLQDMNFFVKVIKFKQVPEVELHYDKSGNSLVYQNMINEKYYLRKIPNFFK